MLVIVVLPYWGDGRGGSYTRGLVLDKDGATPFSGCAGAVAQDTVRHICCVRNVVVNELLLLEVMFTSSARVKATSVEDVRPDALYARLIARRYWALRGSRFEAILATEYHRDVGGIALPQKRCVFREVP